MFCEKQVMVDIISCINCFINNFKLLCKFHVASQGTTNYTRLSQGSDRRAKARCRYSYHKTNTRTSKSSETWRQGWSNLIISVLRQDISDIFQHIDGGLLNIICCPKPIIIQHPFLKFIHVYVDNLY